MDHRLIRVVTTNITAFWGIVLGLLLGLSLAACGNGQMEEPFHTTVPSLKISPTIASTHAQQTVRPVLRYATRTPTSGPPQPTPTLVETIEVLPDELSGQKITFWYPWQGQVGDAMRAIVEEYNDTNPWGVMVNIRTFDSFASLEEAFTASLTEGHPPSLMTVYDDRAQHWDRDGSKLVNLQVYIGDPVYGLTAEEQADFNSVFWQQGVAYLHDSDGGVTSRQLSVPLHRSELVLFYNQTWAAELGYTDLPVTPDELRSQVCTAVHSSRSANSDGLGGLMLTTLPASSQGREIVLRPEQLLGWISSFGGQVSLPEGAGYQFSTPEAVRALEYLKDLQFEGCVYLSDTPNPADEFASRNGLLYLASTAEIPAIKVAFDAVSSQDEWIMLPFPTANGATGVVAYGPSLAIPQTSKLQQLAAWTLLEWLVQPTNQARWVQAVGAYPTRYSTMDFLVSAISADPAWALGLELLPNAVSEPPLASWSVVRWAMGDALAQLFTVEFKAEQIPTLLEDLDRLADEINTQVR